MHLLLPVTEPTKVERRVSVVLGSRAWVLLKLFAALVTSEVRRRVWPLGARDRLVARVGGAHECTVKNF